MLFEQYLKENARIIDECLARFFAKKSAHPDIDRYLYNPVERYTENGGKRHRPLICLLACEAVGGDYRNALSAAAAIEHFQSAALIHDDIADEAHLRRGKPAFHITEGEGLAINAGDLALSFVTGAIAFDDTLTDEVKIRVLREIITMTIRTVEGQALDLGWARDERFDLDIEDYVTMAEHKTAHYSGGSPLAIGAIIGGGTEDQIEALRTFGLRTGLAFQIQDDLLNLSKDRSDASKDWCLDITEGKRTLIVVHALEHSPHADELVSILSAKTSDPKLLARAVQILEEAGSLAFAAQYARELVATAKKGIAGHLEPSEAYELLLSMADFFVERVQ